MLYFPIIWLISILFYVLFFVKLRKNEKVYNMDVKRYAYSKFPDIKTIKTIIKSTDNKDVRRDFKLQLIFLYLAYTMFFVPIIVYFILVIFTSK